MDPSTEEGTNQLKLIADLISRLEIAPLSKPEELLYLAQSEQVVKTLLRSGLDELLEEDSQMFFTRFGSSIVSKGAPNQKQKGKSFFAKLFSKPAIKKKPEEYKEL